MSKQVKEAKERLEIEYLKTLTYEQISKMFDKEERKINNLKKQIKSLLPVVGVTLPKDIEFISKKSWELFSKHYDSETFEKHTKHWNFMEGIRVALKHKDNGN